MSISMKEAMKTAIGQTRAERRRNAREKVKGKQPVKKPYAMAKASLSNRAARWWGKSRVTFLTDPETFK